ACYHCHGTRVTLDSLAARETSLGEMDLPVYSGWPNQGVGRINPDGSQGSCAACHTRHQFSIEMAREPATCAECHKGPDVPAYKVYKVSKHGNIYDAHKEDWDFTAVPWTPGADFTAPTCAACHVSLLVTEDGDVISRRTHQMNDRLSRRLFGLIYAHPHPESPNTTGLRNASGLPLPTNLDGSPVSEGLITPEEMTRRNQRMQAACLTCHSDGWVLGHFRELDEAVETTNAMTRAATQLVSRAWDEELAQGPAAGGNPFDEAVEKMWTEQWLFFANSTRFAAAMAGADYGVFANGRWSMSRNLRQMHDWLLLRVEN
ncbi:MAG: hydroxylamine oxidase, partial [Candidatus Eisenbacteria bacterium]|nr:hydroxylamine oxidase [Candidatus Eisenbacteria bacterium]